MSQENNEIMSVKKAEKKGGMKGGVTPINNKITKQLSLTSEASDKRELIKTLILILNEIKLQ